MSKQAIVVGAGFSGLTAAVVLAELGYRVTVKERRGHLGGNAHDRIDDVTGVRFHPYGPHLFHTNSEKVLEFLSRFTEWTPYVHRVRSQTKYGMVDFPINLNTLRAVFPNAGLLGPAHAEAFLTRLASTTEATDDSLSGVMRRLVGDELFEAFYKGYSEKQWGKPTLQLPAPIAKRVPVRFDYGNTYFDDQFQALPTEGYAGLFARMAATPGITVELSTDVSSDDVLDWAINGTKVVYTGPVDALFDYRIGKLEYRSLRFEWLYGSAQRSDVVINYPSPAVDWTRETDFGLLPTAGVVGQSLIAREFPSAEGDPYYPLPDDRNKALNHLYRDHAADYRHLLLCGRLAEYRYYNMDQAVASALAKTAKFAAKD